MKTLLAPPPPPPTREPLTKLYVIYEGGSQDGETADIDNRDIREVTFGLHRNPNFAVLERYARTISIHPGTGRTIFRLAERSHVATPKESGINAVLRGLDLLDPRVVLDVGA